MSPEQLKNRLTYKSMLSKANWYDEGVPEESFDNDYWNQNEAAFVYSDPDTRDLDSFFHAENNSIRLTIDAQKFGIYVKILYGKEIESVLTLMIEYQDKSKEKYKEFLSDLLEIDKVKVMLGKGDGVIPLTKQIIDNIDNPSFKEVPYEEVSFYLAGQIESSFFIAKDDLKPAHKRCLDYIKKNPDEFSKELLKTKSLKELFYEYMIISCKFDEEGNMIKVFQGGDAFVFDLLEIIREFIKEDSYFLFQDDLMLFWKVVYTKEKVFYYKEDI